MILVKILPLVLVRVRCVGYIRTHSYRWTT